MGWRSTLRKPVCAAIKIHLAKGLKISLETDQKTLYFLLTNPGDPMNRSFILVLVLGFGTVQAQVKDDLIKADGLNFLRMQSMHSGSRWIKSTPYLTTISSDQSASTGAF